MLHGQIITTFFHFRMSGTASFLGSYLTFKACSEHLVPQLRADKTADWESTHREAQETMKRCSALRAETARDERKRG